MMARKMFEKAGLIPGLQAGPKPGRLTVPHRLSRPKAKTAPGTMMGFLTAQSGAVSGGRSAEGARQIARRRGAIAKARSI
jgi:hypothetical protein